MSIGILSFSVVLLIITILSNIFLILVVRRQHSLVGKIFIFLCILMSLWLILLYADSNFGPYIILARSSIAVATIMSVLFFILAHILPDKEFSLKKINVILIYIFTSIMVLLTLSPFVFKNVVEIEGIRRIDVGFGLGFFAFFSTFFSFSAIVTLIRNFIHGTKVDRAKIKIVLIGLSLMLLLITITILIPILFFSNFNFLFLAPIYVLIFLVSIALAILKYHLFNIKIVATEFFVIVLVLMLVSEGLTSGSYLQILYKMFFALLILGVGYLLVKSVKKEIEQRKELATLTHNLEKANVRLQELDRQKTEFLSIASHQLRTPLSIIKGYIELIQDGAYGKVTRKTNKVLQDMDESNERLVKLVDEFLDITRIEQGRTKFTYENKSLCELIASVVKELVERGEKKGISIISSCPKDIDMVYMDEEKVRHVVFNYVDNAIKYSEKGAIKIFVEREDGGVTVRVKDHGLGFEKVDYANLFQKFYRGQNVQGTNVNGTGLGIYVCRKFIEIHGGHVWAHSDGLGKGSEFGFWIPGVKKEDEENKKSEA